MSSGGKGSSARPFSVSYREFSDNWDQVFKKPKPAELNPLQPNDWQDVLSTYDCFDIEDEK